MTTTPDQAELAKVFELPTGHNQDPLDNWESIITNLVNPDHPHFEKNIIRRQIRAQTAAQENDLRVSPDQVRARLIQKQRDLIADTDSKGVAGGDVAKFAEKTWLIQGLIAEGCLTGIAAFAKVGKTKALTELAASLIHQQSFMGNPEWMPAPGPHKLILWWTDQPGVDSAQYLKARGLMEPDGTLHPQIIKLYTQEDGLCWDDQGMDEIIQITTAEPDSILLTDSFYANVQPIYGSDQEAESGGALIDVQTYCTKRTKAHVCAFHSPQEKDKVGVEAMRGHGSAKGVVSSTISLHFLEKKSATGSNKWVSDKENPHRRLVFEGRGPYVDMLVRLDGAAGTWEVIGKFDRALAELQSDDQKSESIGGLTEGQRQTLEWVGAASEIWKHPHGVTVQQVAACKVQHLNREATGSEIETTRKQLRACTKAELLSQTTKGNTHYWAYKQQDG
ncbi:AAA family ATPase [Synechococcus sp. UW179A]|uniref:AAA family ATPase n=1 Tax=Synechococcus sp. UW179A TaxID=2575510 RepID=UPI000E0E5CC7|nr:AAA family ATPase [Synechococcus sp. UW179A]